MTLFFLQHFNTLESSHPEVYALAKPSMDVYSFPVQLIVSHPNGTVIHTLNLNEFMAVDDVEEEEEGAADNKPEIRYNHATARIF